MTAKQADTVNWIYRGVMAVAWAACAAIYGSVDHRLSAIEQKLETMRSIQDGDHSEFRVKIMANKHDIDILEDRVRGIEIDLPTIKHYRQ